MRGLSQTASRVYEVIARRFLSIFFPSAEYAKVSVSLNVKKELFSASFKVLSKEGYLSVMKNSFAKSQDSEENDEATLQALKKVKKGDILPVEEFSIKEGETSPPKRYNSGSIILAMENAGQLIEDEELRAQIKGSGIGTSATRAEILKKLNTIGYIATNPKTQIITPTMLGEIVYDVVDNSIKQLLNPELTASWEKGLTYVSNGEITSDEYLNKLEGFVTRRTQAVKSMNNQSELVKLFNDFARFYK